MNAIVVAVVIMLGLSLARFNVVASLCLGALIGGLMGGLDLQQTIDAFSGGLGGGATVALSYALLGAFAVCIDVSGLPKVLSRRLISGLHTDTSTHGRLKWALIGSIALAAIFSQNLIPVHIAFIPILIPPLVGAFNRLNLDRRLIACVLTFGLVTPYMLLPVGFGAIYLNDILLANVASNGVTAVDASMLIKAMAIPAAGMVLGLLVAIVFSYRQPRVYRASDAQQQASKSVPQAHVWVALLAIVVAFVVQLWSGAIILAALAGYFVFVAGGVVRWVDANSVFANGMKMMAQIGFVMIAAAGFAAVMKATGHVDTLVSSAAEWIGGNKSLAAAAMLLVGLLVTMGIGSSFSTIPIIATVFVPLALQLGFSPLATLALVGTAGALGDAGSPASDSTLGPSMGLSIDGQHDHMWDSVVPTFLHYNLPLLLFGWFAAMVL